MTAGWVFDDGGRADAGYKGRPGDCVVRAIAIAAAADYQTVYSDLFDAGRDVKVRGKALRNPSPRDGVNHRVYKPYLARLGWRWTPTMSIGSGTTVHLKADELPTGRLIVRCSRHLCAVIDGVIHDTFDPSRDGTRAVYGYWEAPA